MEVEIVLWLYLDHLDVRDPKETRLRIFSAYVLNLSIMATLKTVAVDHCRVVATIRRFFIFRIFKVFKLIYSVTLNLYIKLFQVFEHNALKRINIQHILIKIEPIFRETQVQMVKKDVGVAADAK